MMILLACVFLYCVLRDVIASLVLIVGVVAAWNDIWMQFNNIWMHLIWRNLTCLIFTLEYVIVFIPAVLYMYIDWMTIAVDLTRTCLSPGAWMRTTSQWCLRTVSRACSSSDICGWMITVWPRFQSCLCSIRGTCRRSRWHSIASATSQTTPSPTSLAWWCCECS